MFGLMSHITIIHILTSHCKQAVRNNLKKTQRVRAR